MNPSTLRGLLGLVAAAALAGCGGGGGGVDPTASVPSFSAVLAQLNTKAGLTDPAVAGVFDNSYLDSGTTKSQSVDALAQEAVAMSADAAHSLFPQVTLSDATLSNCDSQNVCTLTGTLHNTDADETTVVISTKVMRVGDSYRLLGDQLTG